MAFPIFRATPAQAQVVVFLIDLRGAFRGKALPYGFRDARRQAKLRLCYRPEDLWTEARLDERWTP